MEKYYAKLTLDFQMNKKIAEEVAPGESPASRRGQDKCVWCFIPYIPCIVP